MQLHKNTQLCISILLVKVECIYDCLGKALSYLTTTLTGRLEGLTIALGDIRRLGDNDTWGWDRVFLIASPSAMSLATTPWRFLKWKIKEFFCEHVHTLYTYMYTNGCPVYKFMCMHTVYAGQISSTCKLLSLVVKLLRQKNELHDSVQLHVHGLSSPIYRTSMLDVHKPTVTEG